MEVLSALDEMGAGGSPLPGGSSSTVEAGGQRQRPVNAPAELLDYAAVDGIEDLGELEWVLATLRRGVHGRYPELEQHVEARLLALSPPEAQAQAARLRAPPPTTDEVAALGRELRAWEEALRAQDGAGKGKGAGAAKKPLPPVRYSTGAGSSTEGGSSNPPAESQAPPKPKAAEPPTPLSPPSPSPSTSSESDGSEPAATEATPAPVPVPAPTPLRVEVRSVEDAMVAAVVGLSAVSERLEVSALPLAERGVAARAAKEEGNALFKAGDLEGAVERYTASLAFDSSSQEHAAPAYANRALAHLKLGRLVEAEADCQLALERDAGYSKARLRRGQARLQRGDWAGAREDVELLLAQARAKGGDGREEREAKALLAELATAEAKAKAEAEASSPPEAPQKPQQEEQQRRPVAAEPAKAPAPVRAPAPAPAAPASTVDPALLVGPRPGYRRVTIEEEEKGDGDEEKEGKPQEAQGGPAPSPSPAAAAATENGVEREVEALKQRGNAALQGGDAAGAVAAYTQALGLDPLLPVALRVALLNNRALARLRQGAGDEEAAAADAAAVLALEPGNVKALYRRGKAVCALAGRRLDSDNKEEEDDSRGLVGLVGLVGLALEDLEAVLGCDPRNKDARLEYKRAKELLARAQAKANAQAKAKAKAAAASGGGAKEEVKAPPGTPQRPGTAKSATAASTVAEVKSDAKPSASSSSSSSSSLLLQEVTTRPRLPAQRPPPQATEQKENAAPAPNGAAKAKAKASAAAGSVLTTPLPLASLTTLPLREPTAPPKSLHELEREWRSLRRSPPALARYLRRFTPATFARVFKPATDPDVVAGVFRVVAEEMCGGSSGGGDAGDAGAVARVLEGMTRAEGFDMMCVTLSKADQAHVARALGFLDDQAGKGGEVTPEAVAALKAQYGVV